MQRLFYAICAPSVPLQLKFSWKSNQKNIWNLLAFPVCMHIQPFKFWIYLKVAHFSIILHSQEDLVLFPVKKVHRENCFKNFLNAMKSFSFQHWLVNKGVSGEFSVTLETFFFLILEQNIGLYGWRHIRFHSMLPKWMSSLQSADKHKSWIFMTTENPFPVFWVTLVSPQHFKYVELSSSLMSN